MSTLTPTQSLILTTAIRDHDGQLVWFPDHLKGGARQKVLEGLAKRDLIAAEGDAWRVTAAGSEALGQTPPEAPTRDQSGASAVLLDEIDGGDPTDEELEAAHAAQVAHDEVVNAIKEKPEAEAPAPSEAKPRRSREDSKQATVIRMLQRPEGATLDQLVEATGWQKHTVRGCLAGALKKKLGLTITSAKGPNGDRVYRIVTNPAG
jgi:hypothetical protein